MLALLVCALVASALLPSVMADTLLMSSVTYRHGDRSSVATFPNNTCDESCWPQGYGQLTQRGMRQHYVFGQYLRQRYKFDNPLLNASYYYRNQVYVRSTDVDRTLMSAGAQLSSFYPPTGFQEFEPDLPWMPLPVHTVKAHNDSLLRGYDTAENACPRYTKLYNDIPTLGAYQEVYKPNKEFIDDIGRKAGVAYQLNLQNIYLVEDPLYCQGQHGIRQPEWVTAPVLDRMHMLGGYSMQLMYQTPEMQRLTAGVLVGQILGQMQNRSNNEALPEERVFLYSAHDTTVAALLNALQLYNGIQPPYASSLIIELWRPDNAGPDYVKVLYRNETANSTSEPYDLTSLAQGCDGQAQCSLTNFYTGYQDRIVTDWYAACHGDQTSGDLSSVAIASISVAAVFFLATMLLLALVISTRRRSGSYNKV